MSAAARREGARNNRVRRGEAELSAVLWTRNFRLYFTLRTVSMLGDAMMPIAVTIGVLAAGYGAAGVGYAFAAWSAPVALLVLFGGALADRFTPRRMMAFADIARVVTQSLLAVVLSSHVPVFWQILCLQAVAGAATATFQPGVASVLPQVALDVQRANSILRISEALVTLLGPAAAGVLVSFSGAGTVLYADAGTFAVSALCLSVLRLGAGERRVVGVALWRNVALGWREFRSRTWLWSVILIWSVYGLLVFAPTSPLGAAVIVSEHGSVAFGVVSSMFGAGAVGGGLIALRLRPARPLAVGAAAISTFALCPLVTAFRFPVPVICAGFLLAGIGFALWNVIWLTTMQTHVPPAALNRVYVYDVAGSTMVLPLGRALAGPAADQFGIRTVLFAATIFAVIGSIAMLCVPAIRGLRREPPVFDEPAASGESGDPGAPGDPGDPGRLDDAGQQAAAVSGRLPEPLGSAEMELS
jgi:MFS family permease